MRHGYADNEKLAEYVEATPRLARPIIETLTIEASDLKDTFDEFDAADSSPIGGLAEFTIFDEGGCRLAGAGTDALLSSDRSIDTSADITSLVPPTESPLGVAVVELGGVNTTGREIWGAKAFLDPNSTGLGKEVEFWHCNLYQFEGVDINGNEEAWNLRLIASDRVEATATSAGDVGFSFAKRATVPVVGDPPDVSDPRIGAGLSIKGATVVMVIYALKSDGDIAENVSWRCNSGASSVTSGSHTIFRYNLTALDTPAEGSTLRYTATSVVGVPDMEFTANTSYSDATIEWVTTSNKLDLGQTPASGTDLELTLQTATPSDTSVTAQIYNDADATWYTFVDNDIIGEDRSSEDGSDLSAMTRQQSYQVKATLSTSTDTSHTPRLYRIGVQEVTSEVVDGLLDVTAASWAIDPITSQSEIPTMSLTLHRDGEKDYRSWSDELFSTNQLNELLFRVWVGHPDLAKRYWLHIDDFIVGNYTPTEAGINVELLSPLQYALVEIPPKTGSSRAPVPYENATLKSVYDDIVTTQAAIQARYIGAGIGDITSSNNVTKTLAVEEQAVDVLRQLNYINGSATISSQGVLKVVPLFDGESPEPHANFPYDELTVLSTDTGFDRRITKFDVPYGWDGNKYTNEQVAKPPQDVLDRLGPIAMSQANQLDDGVARWLRTSGHADRIGSRMIENFLNGLSQIHFRSHTAKPWLEPGDAVAIESDVYVGIDPRNNRALRGRGWSKGIVTQCHDIMGHEFTVWVQSWYNVIASNTTFQWDAGMTPGGKVLYQPYDPVAEQTQALWRAEFGTQAITITAGAGLTGGGDLTANRTIAMSRYGFETLGDPATAHSGKDVIPFYDNSQTSFDWLLLDTSDFAISAGTLSLTSGASGLTGTSTGLTDDGTDASVKYTATSNLIDGAADSGDIAAADLILYRDDDTGIVRKDTVGALPFTNNAGTVTEVTVGTGLDRTNGTTTPNITLDLDELTAGGTLIATDHLVAVNGTSTRKQLISSIPLSIFSNDSGFTSNDGTVTSVSGTGTVSGLTLSGTVTSSGNLTLGGTLSVNESDIVDGSILARLAADETVSGTYSFSAAPRLNAGLDLQNESSEPSATAGYQMLYSYNNGSTFELRSHDGTNRRNIPLITGSAANNQLLVSTGTDHEADWSSGPNTNELTWDGTNLNIAGSGGFTGDGSGLTDVVADSSTIAQATPDGDFYPMLADATSGSISHFHDSANLRYNLTSGVGTLEAERYQIGTNGTMLAVQDADRFGNAGWRFQPSGANQVSAVSLAPTGTQDRAIFRLYNDSDTANTEALEIEVDGTFARIRAGQNFGTGATDMTEFYINNANSASTSSLRLQVAGSDHLIAGAAAGGSTWVYVPGVLRVGNELRLASGSVGDPSLAFTSQETTGLYYTSNQINWTIAGTRQMYLNAGGLRLRDPTAQSLWLHEDDAAADEGNYRLVASGGDLYIQATNDAESSFSTGLRFINNGSGGISSIYCHATLRPNSDASASLGANSVRWNTLYVDTAVLTNALGVAYGGIGLSAAIANDELLVSTGSGYEGSGNLTYNASTGLNLASGVYSGDGSGLTDVVSDSSTVTDLTTQTATYYPIMADGTSGAVSHFVDASELSYTSSTDTLNVVSLAASSNVKLGTNADLVFSGGSGSVLTHTTSSTRDKIRVWNSSSYTIGMQNNFTFGPLVNDYAMTFQMNNDTDRGFWWGDTSHGQSGGAMALSTNGKLTVAHSIRLGYGESDTTIPGGTWGLDVGSASRSMRLRASNGAEMLRIQDSGGSDSAANPYLTFYDSATTRLGYIGFGSTSNNIYYMRNDRTNGLIELSTHNSNVLRLNATSSATVNPYVSWHQQGNRVMYMQFVDSGNEMRLVNEESNTGFVSFWVGNTGTSTHRKFIINGLGSALGRVFVENAQFYVEEYQTALSVAATVNCDWDRSNQLHLTITSTVTTINIDSSSMQAGGSYILMVEEGTSAPATVTWSSGTPIIWANNSEPTLNGGNLGDVTVVQFFKTTTGTDHIIGSWFLAQ